MNTRHLAVLALVAAFTQASAQTYDLSPRFEKGTKSVYNLTFDIETPGQKVIYKSKLRNEIIDVKEDKSYITASYQTDHVLVVDGKNAQSNAEELTEVTTYDKHGRPTAIGGDMTDGASFRVANLTSFIAPSKAVKIGESWSVSIKASEKDGTRDVTHRYKLLQITKINNAEVAEVQVNVAEDTKENPASTKGKVWVNIKTGETVRYQVDIKNMLVGPQYVNGSVTIEKTTSA